MSTIDSGLGWSCDSDYYVADNSTIATYSGTDIKKTNNGGAVVCQVHMTKYNDNSIIAMSTIKENTYLNVDSYFPDGAHSTVIDGVTWWWYLTNSVSGTVTANVPTVTVYDKLDTAGFLEAASVEKTAIGIVSTNFLKEFVEGVEAETARRVNALLNMIAPTFNVLNSYSVDDIVVYSNKLYKCTIAHSGAWNASDFAETTISQLLN